MALTNIWLCSPINKCDFCLRTKAACSSLSRMQVGGPCREWFGKSRTTLFLDRATRAHRKECETMAITVEGIVFTKDFSSGGSKSAPAWYG